MAKVNNEVASELKGIRGAIDDMYDKLNVTLYKKKIAAKVSYSEVNPFDAVSENFEYISKKIRELQTGSTNVGDE